MNDDRTLGELGYVESFTGVPGLGQMADLGDGLTKRYFGKYRGTVFNNADPEFRGRLILRVPEVLGMFPSSWALPCLPVAGPQMGFYLVPPPVGTGVWVEFEHGNPQKPIWVGCFWSTAAEPPAKSTKLVAPGLPAIVMSSVAQNAIVVADTPGIIITTGSGSSTILITEAGISITAPIIQFNGGALTIT